MRILVKNMARPVFMTAIAVMALVVGIISPARSDDSQIAARPTTEHTVEIRDFAFVPATLRVRPGDRVTWINRDIAPHTVTAADESWDSGEMAQGAAYTHTVKADQTDNYFCRFHPSMTARLDIRRN
jgi:plastocyanin